MKGLVFSNVGKVELKDVDKPGVIDPTDALVKITLTTICGSDVHLKYGHIPTTPEYVLGHEYVGVVEEVGDQVRSLHAGDRVTGPAAPYCSQCDHC